MSATYYIQGYVDVRVFVDTDVNTTQSATGADIAEIITMNIRSRVGNCEMINHGLVIDGLHK